MLSAPPELRPHHVSPTSTSRELPDFLAEGLDEMARCVAIIESRDREIPHAFKRSSRAKLIEERNEAYAAYLRARAHVSALRRNDKASLAQRKFKPRKFSVKKNY